MDTFTIPNLLDESKNSDISINPIKEKLVSLEGVREDRLIIKSDVYVREMVVTLLLLAASKLPRGYKIIVTKGWKEELAFNTGGAVHIQIQDDELTLLNMGSEYGDINEKAPMRHYEDRYESKNDLNEKELVYLDNRRTIYNIMTSVGFTCSKENWWHYNFGNKEWGLIKNKPAFYDRIALD